MCDCNNSLMMLFSLVLRILIFGRLLTFSACFNLENREPIIKRGSPGTYFGYSVAQHKMYKGSNVAHNWLLVGAPLGHNLQPGTNRSGALFKCPISYYTDDCKQVPTDGRRSEDSPELFPPRGDEIKEDQWMGVTVRSQGPEGMVLVCAHRYATVIRESRCGQGLCYTLTNELDYENAYEPCKGRPIKREHQDFGLCQTGTSGALLSDGNAVLGAPGPYTWRGTLFVQAVDGDFLNRDKTVYMGPLSDQHGGDGEPVNKYSYLGMSVTAGKFFGNETISFAAGAPRANDTGQVLIFAKRYLHSVMDVVLRLNGEQFASSFGYEITALDINGDGTSDLFVGAPFYFDRTSGGAVYIYTELSKCLNNKHKLHHHLDDCVPTHRLTGVPESRFGFALAGIGDINRDGFEDVAVGAPYEDDGVVYVYLGSKSGPGAKPSQRLTPLRSGIVTLGYSLSGGLDMDENGYPDLLVGAYESDSVLLYRARVIIDIDIDVSGSGLKNIDVWRQKCDADTRANTTCFTFRACGKLHVPKSAAGHRALDTDQSLVYTLEAETYLGDRKFSRVYFKLNEGPPTQTNYGVTDTKHIIIRRFPLESNQLIYCQNETVYLKENTRDILSPIRFRLNYTLGNDRPGVAMLNQQKAVKEFAATFQKDCGNNDVCESELVLESRLMLPLLNETESDPKLNEDGTKSKPEPETSYLLTLGEQEELRVNVIVTNQGEPAYETALFIEHNSGLSYIAMVDDTAGTNKPNAGPGVPSTIICNYRNETLVACNLGNPFKQGVRVNITLRFEPRQLVRGLPSRFVFSVHVNSTSKELSERTRARLTAVIVRRAELAIMGAATSHVFYGGQVKGESAMQHPDDIGSRVIHKYQVVNGGPWKVEHLEVHVEWPFQVANNKPLGKWLLYLEERPIVDGGDYCRISDEYVNPLGLTPRPGTQELPTASSTDSTLIPTSPLPYNTTTSATFRRSKRDTEMVIRSETIIDSDGHERHIVNMNCQNSTTKCIRFHCIIRNLERGGEATIQIRSRLWNATLVEDYPRVDWVRIVSRAWIIVPPEHSVEQNDTSNDEAIAETLAYPDLKDQQEAEPAPLWIIIAAVVVGLLLLVLVTFILWKIGFFKRQRIDPTLTGNLEKHSREGQPFLSH